VVSGCGAELELEDTGQPVASLSGFDDLESALVTLTHPMHGYYHRRDGRLGAYRIWHAPLEMSTATINHARFDVLDRLELVPYDRQGEPHSVLLQHETEFTIYLPPGRA
jgi:hypothetical protein